MKVMMRAIGFVTLLVALAPLSGCVVTAARAVVREAQGAQGEVRWATPLPVATLAEYRSVRAAGAGSALPQNLLPSRVVDVFNAEAQEWQRRISPEPGAEPALEVQTEMIYFQGKGLLSGSQLIARVRVLGRGAPLADGLLVAESRAVTSGSERDLSRAALAALGDALQRAGLPKPARSR